MTYFEDLSEYTYSAWSEPMSNVGWLSGDHTFPVGVVSPALIAALIDLARNPKNPMRGLHDCELCDQKSPIEVYDASGVVFLGNGEIHVRSASGILYAAPTLIVHYVMRHAYLPPSDFVRSAIQVLGSSLQELAEGDEP